MFLPLTPVRCLYRGVDLFGRKEAIVSGDSRFTYAEFGERCERLAAGLQSLGVRPGDRVALLSFNTHQLIEGYYGPPLIGAVAMPLNVRLTQAELIEILNHSGASVLIYESEFAPLLEAFQKNCPAIQHFVTTGAGELAYEDLLSRGRIDRPDLRSFDENSIAELFYTSGSTGSPKGVALSHRTLYLHALSLEATNSWNGDDVCLHTIPLFHANGWGGPQAATMMGRKQVMVRRFEPSFVLGLIEKEQATLMALVPVMANALLNCADLSRYTLSSMREIMIGGAASSPELIDRLEKAFHCSVMAGYGLTETSPMVSTARRKSGIHFTDEASRLFHNAKAGWAAAGNEMLVVDSDMKPVPRDSETIGEIVVRGDNVMDGYYNEPADTRAVFSGDWFHTGDMAVWNEESYVHIVDRKKDIIISGGENISSIEVEKAIFAHPCVFECAVVSAPDAKWGEIPVAIVVLKPDQTLTSEELLAFIEKRLARFKLPRLIQFSTEPLPKTGTGKILKRDIRNSFWAGKERRVQGG